MSYLADSLSRAVTLLVGFDPAVGAVIWTSLYTTGCATFLASLIGLPFGLWLGMVRFRGRRALVILLSTAMALPTVVVGLLLFGLFSRQGPLGPLGWLFAPAAMIAGQTVLAIPIIAQLVFTAVSGADKRIVGTALTLGATPVQAGCQLLREIRFGVVAAIIAGFGRVIAEVGVAMMLGGNIRGSTRTMTTAIALETSKGEFAFGLALGLVLLVVALGVNLLLNYFQQRGLHASTL